MRAEGRNSALTSRVWAQGVGQPQLPALRCVCVPVGRGLADWLDAANEQSPFETEAGALAWHCGGQ